MSSIRICFTRRSETTTRELGHGSCIPGYERVDCWRKEGVSLLRMRVPTSSYLCPQCGNRDVIRCGLVDWMAHAPRVGMDGTVLFIQIPRMECGKCQRVLNGSFPGIEPRCNYTKSFARMVVDLTKMMTICDVSEWMGVSMGVIRSVDKSGLTKRFRKPPLRDVEVIAIDEIYVGKSNKYFTIVIDWQSKAIVYVGEGKGQVALKHFWRRLRGSGAKIKAVATDMASAYHAAVIKNLPKAKQVFDRFHIVNLMNDKLTQLRRDIQSEAETTDRQVLKGLRWLLLKHPEKLDESKNERTRLQEAFDLIRSLAVAYYLKEDLSQIWQQTA